MNSHKNVYSKGFTVKPKSNFTTKVMHTIVIIAYYDTTATHISVTKLNTVLGGCNEHIISHRKTSRRQHVFWRTTTYTYTSIDVHYTCIDVPLCTLAQIKSSQCLGRTYCRVDKNLLVSGWIWSIERRRPRTTDCHWLVLATESNQKLDQSSRMLKWLADVVEIIGKSTSLVIDVIKWWSC